jgi:hypothetical protein
MMTVKEIRAVLYSRMIVLSYLMSAGKVQRSLQKYKAIELLTNCLNSIVNCSVNVHYRWLLKYRNQVIDILPPEGRYTKQRQKILELLREAEQTINADYRKRVLVS